MEKEKKEEKKWRNRKFNIFGDIWTVHFKEQVFNSEKPDEEPQWVYGVATSGAGKNIYISLKNANGEPLTEKDILNTIVHECVHAILISGQYLTETVDEPLVEFLAKGILSLLKSKTMEV